MNFFFNRLGTFFASTENISSLAEIYLSPTSTLRRSAFRCSNFGCSSIFIFQSQWFENPNFKFVINYLSMSAWSKHTKKLFWNVQSKFTCLGQKSDSSIYCNVVILVAFWCVLPVKLSKKAVKHARDVKHVSVHHAPCCFYKTVTYDLSYSRYEMIPDNYSSTISNKKVTCGCKIKQLIRH